MTVALKAEVTVASDWLAEPEQLLPYLVEAADFWKGTYDEEFGGFFTHVDRSGAVTDSEVKSLLTQSRNAYAMIKAFQVTGDPSWLAVARGSLDFQLAHGRHEATGGWYNWVMRDGSVPGEAEGQNWESFRQHYLLLGLGHMLEAAPDDVYRVAFEAGMAANENLLWDARPGLEGYFSAATFSGASASGKGFTPTVDAVTTHALQRVLLSHGGNSMARLVKLGENMVEHLVGSMDAPGVRMGFPEFYNNNWEPQRNPSWALAGHLVKTGWCLGRIHLVHPDERFRAAMVHLLDYSLNPDPVGRDAMWDELYGGHYGGYRPYNGTRNNDRKGWWTLEQSVLSGLVAYTITGDEKYLDAAGRSLDFWLEHFWDTEYGDCFRTVERDGSNPVLDYKGNPFKAGYHTVELLYLTYLYAKVFLHGESFDLFYQFSNTGVDNMSMSLRPIATEEGRLMITAVEKDGESWAGFLPETRQVSIPAGSEGIYRVTYDLSTNHTLVKWPFASIRNVPGWRYQLSGYIYMSEDLFPWIYHAGHGWIWTQEAGEADGFLLYVPEAERGWLYSSKILWPFVYDWKAGDWGLF